MPSVRNLIFVLPLLATVAFGQDSQEKTQAIAELLRPTLVRIHVVDTAAVEGHEVRQESFGSGVIVTPDGCVVTNHHVAGKAIWLSATLSDKSEVEATLIGTDPLADVAVIRLAPRRDGKPYEIAKWGDSSKLRIGQRILAIGCPLAFSQSVTSGIVSNNELILPKQMGEMDLDGEDVGSIVRWIGHDAQIRPGNSGGPLVNMDGEIVGINEISVGLGGAIPSNLVKDVFEQIQTNGKVTRAYLGVGIQPRLSQSAEATGALIGNVDADSPAAKAGLLPGDILVSVGPVRLDTRYREQIPLANLELSRLALDKPTPIVFRRNGQEKTASLSPTRRHPATEPESELAEWGFTAMALSESVVRDAHLAQRQGVLLTGIAAGSPAAEGQPPLKPFDILVKAGTTSILSIDQLKEFSAGIEPREGGTPVLAEVIRNGEHILSVINVNRTTSEDVSQVIARPWLPVETQVLTPLLAKAMGFQEGIKGVRVTKLYKDAKTMGLRIGDLITQVDATSLEVSQNEDAHVFSDLIRQYKIGSSLLLQGFRDHAPLTLTVKLPQAKKRQSELPRFSVEGLGLILRDASFEDADDDTDETPTGVVVGEVQPGSWASLAGLESGDLITQIGDASVANLRSARTQLATLKAAKSKNLIFYVTSGGHVGFVELRTGWDHS